MKQVVSRVWDVLWSITETAAVTTQEALSVAQRTRVCVFDFFFLDTRLHKQLPKKRTTKEKRRENIVERISVTLICSNTVIKEL